MGAYQRFPCMSGVCSVFLFSENRSILSYIFEYCEASLGIDRLYFRGDLAHRLVFLIMLRILLTARFGRQPTLMTFATSLVNFLMIHLSFTNRPMSLECRCLVQSA